MPVTGKEIAFDLWLSPRILPCVCKFKYLINNNRAVRFRL